MTILTQPTSIFTLPSLSLFSASRHHYLWSCEILLHKTTLVCKALAEHMRKDIHLPSIPIHVIHVIATEWFLDFAAGYYENGTSWSVPNSVLLGIMMPISVFPYSIEAVTLSILLWMNHNLLTSLVSMRHCIRENWIEPPVYAVLENMNMHRIQAITAKIQWCSLPLPRASWRGKATKPIGGD